MSKLLEAVFDEMEFRLAQRSARRQNKRDVAMSRPKIITKSDVSFQDESLIREERLVHRRGFEKPGLMVKLLTLTVLMLWSFEAQGQALRDAFRTVQQSVVIVRTEEKGLAPFPQQGFVSLNGLGSGVVISADGKVLTAAHLVQSADKTVVEFANGEVVSAQVIGCAFSADVAVLQLERNSVNYVAAKLGDSDSADVGDEVFVVGAPYGISRTLTAGHVSGRREVNTGNKSLPVEFLQTDAAINTGNSGSPIFNMKGEVIGIVSNIMSRSGGSEGLAFASTSNTARHLLLDQKTFWTGIEGILVQGDLASALNLTQPAGLLVQRVAGGSIAGASGIRGGSVRANVEGQEIVLGGDIILAVNGIPVTDGESYDQIYQSIASIKPGQSLVMTIFRQGQVLKLSIQASEAVSTASR
jgi:serine protease Do